MQADTRLGLACRTNSLDRLSGPPIIQLALTDSIVDALVITRHPCFLKPLDIPQKWLQISFVFPYASAPCVHLCFICLHARPSEHMWGLVCVLASLCLYSIQACYSELKPAGTAEEGVYRVRSKKRARNHKGRREWSIQLLSFCGQKKKKSWQEEGARPAVLKSPLERDDLGKKVKDKNKEMRQKHEGRVC